MLAEKTTSFHSDHCTYARLSSTSLPAAPTLLRETQIHNGESSSSCWCCRHLMSSCYPGNDPIEGGCYQHHRHNHQRHACYTSHCCLASCDSPWIQQQQQQQHQHRHYSSVFSPHHRHTCHGSASCSLAPTLFVICPQCFSLIPCASPFPHVNNSNPYATLKCGHCLKFSKFSACHLHQPAASKMEANSSPSNVDAPRLLAADFDRFSCGFVGEDRHRNLKHMSMESSVPCGNSNSIAMVHKVVEEAEEYDGCRNVPLESNTKVRSGAEEDAKVQFQEPSKSETHGVTASDGRIDGDEEAVGLGHSSSHGVGVPYRNRARLSDFLFAGTKLHPSSSDAVAVPHICSHDQTMLRHESSANASSLCLRMHDDDTFAGVQPHEPLNALVDGRTVNRASDKWNSIKGEDTASHSNVDVKRGYDSHRSNVNENSRDFPNWNIVQDWVNSIDIQGFMQEDEVASALFQHEDARNSYSDEERGTQKRCGSEFQAHSNDHVQEKDEEKDDQRSVSVFLRRLVSKEYRRDANNSSKRRVVVNGHILSSTAVKKAEERAGRLRPGSYWYDNRAGFWGVMEGPCLGILPPFIEELSHPMSKHCSNGSSEVYVNGRELHEKDLEVLAKRGLPKTPGGMYVLGFDGLLMDVTSGKELRKLGKLAPTVEKRGRGFGMFTPSSKFSL